jgi:hypothetical protein
MNATSSLSPRAAFGLAAASVLFLVAAVALVAMDDGVRPALGAKAQSGPTARSTSALGYGAFVEMLEALRVPVIVSAFGAEEGGRETAAVVLLEPRAGTVPQSTIDNARATEAVLVVVPKWNWTANPRNRAWARSVSLIPTDEAVRAVSELIPDIRLVRPGGSVNWRSPSRDARPTIAAPQFVVSDRLRPVIASDQGILVGTLESGPRTIWVLSDPDLMSNHGIGRGDNALLAASIIDDMRGTGQTVLFDETVHGGVKSTNAWRSFFEPPLVGVTTVFAAAALLLGWAAFKRFGTPLPEGRPIARGTNALIESTTDLLRRHGSAADMLGRYATAVFRESAAAIAGPHRGSQPDLELIMDEAAKRSGIRSYTALRLETGSAVRAAQSSPQAALKFATVLHQWKENLLDGPGRRKRPVRQHQG